MKTNPSVTIRFRVQRDNPLFAKLSKSIASVIEPIAANMKIEAEIKIHVFESYINIWVKNNDIFDAKTFSDFILELTENVSPVVAEYGYFYSDRHTRNEYFVLKFPKAHGTKVEIQCKKKSIELKKFIEEAISDAYAEYNEQSTAEVHINEKGIQIQFDSERPYLDKNFWVLLRKVDSEIDGRLKAEGYMYQRTEVFFDFIIWHYILQQQREIGERERER